MTRQSAAKGKRKKVWLYLCVHVVTPHSAEAKVGICTSRSTEDMDRAQHNTPFLIWRKKKLSKAAKKKKKRQTDAPYVQIRGEKKHENINVSLV